jgi:LL-diaminopimelate aminotransferase
MIRINENFLKLKASYLFSDIAKRIASYQEANPDSSIIKLGIGDVTEPLPETCRAAFHSAIDEMGTRSGFHGYGPEQGYEFLRKAIAGKRLSGQGREHFCRRNFRERWRKV